MNPRIGAAVSGTVPVVCLVAALAFGGVAPAAAYPEFETFVEMHSGRSIDCSLCHTHPDGPEGVRPGQIRALTPEELERLNQARGAFEPGTRVDSPILNDFGDLILRVVGKRRFLELRTSDPEALAAELGFDSDLDGDGIPDAQEYLQGTHPLDSQHGDPWLLFRNNLRAYALHLTLILLATLLGLYGLHHLLAWFDVTAQAAVSEPGRKEGSAP